jgi:hypothetical protein
MPKVKKVVKPKLKTVYVNPYVKKRKIGICVWEDAYSNASFVSPGELDGYGLLTQSVGYLVENTEKSIVLAQSDGGHGDPRFRNYIVIPTQYIRHLKVVEIN